MMEQEQTLMGGADEWGGYPLDAEAEGEVITGLLWMGTLPEGAGELRESCFTEGRRWVWRTMRRCEVEGDGPGPLTERATWLLDQAMGSAPLRRVVMDLAWGAIVDDEWLIRQARELRELARRRALLDACLVVAAGIRTGALSASDAAARLKGATG
jgi:hypothetical protein